MEPLISIKKISKDFRLDRINKPALRDINLDLFKGEFVSIVGPSGCGKSTLLRIIAGLERSSEGMIQKPENINLSMIFQNFAIFPWLTVRENIGFGLKCRGVGKKDIWAKVDKFINEVGLEEVSEKHPKELSGGMKQRVGIARALAMEPDVLLLDEPFSSLDIFTAKKLRNFLLEIWRKNNLTILMVSHLVEEAIELADRVVVLSSVPGQIKEIVKVDLPRPRNSREQSFYNLLDKIQEMIKA